MPDNSPYYSVVVPLCNEEENLPVLYERLNNVFKGLGKEYEFIFVDDGSKDKTREVLKYLCSGDQNVKSVIMSRNFGSHVGLQAGLDYASGEIIIQMTGDLQDKPEDIPALLTKLDEGYDLTYTVNNTRHDPLLKKFFAWLYFRVASSMGVNIQIRNALIAMRKKVAVQVRRLREPDRYYMGLVDWVGFRRTYVEVERSARLHGRTKYSFAKSFRLGLNTILEFSDVWFSLMKTCFALAMMFFLLFTVAVAGIWIASGNKGLVNDTIMLLILGFQGVVLILFGSMVGYLGRIHLQSLNRPLYIVDETINLGPKADS